MLPWCALCVQEFGFISKMPMGATHSCMKILQLGASHPEATLAEAPKIIIFGSMDKCCLGVLGCPRVWIHEQDVYGGNPFVNEVSDRTCSIVHVAPLALPPCITSVCLPIGWMGGTYT